MYSYPEIFEHGAASVETAAFLYIPRDDVGKSNMYFEIISDISFCSGISGSEIIPDFNYYCSFKYSKLKPNNLSFDLQIKFVINPFYSPSYV